MPATLITRGSGSGEPDPATETQSTIAGRVGVADARIASDHVLTLPASAAIVPLALAWFPDAVWVAPPVGGRDTSERGWPRSAGHRGPSQQGESVPGLLRLAPDISLSGPHPVPPTDAAALGLPPRHVMAYVLVREAGGRAVPADHRSDLVRRWMVAAAQHARGAVLTGGAGPAVIPDVDRSVDLRLFSAHALPSQTTLALVRTVLAQARVVEQGASSPDRVDGAGGRGPLRGSGPTDYEILAETPYDGAICLRVSRSAELPPALLSIPWRDSGPFRYSARWISDDSEAQSESPSAQHLVARSRVAPVVRRLVGVMQGAIAGTVLDEGGFIRSVGTDA